MLHQVRHLVEVEGRLRWPKTRREANQLKLHHLKPAPGSKKEKIRVGRGEGGRRGKTAGRGTKGLKARNTLRPGFEGGQTPLSMRLPKLPGFTNPNKEEFAIVNLAALDVFGKGAEVTPDELAQPWPDQASGTGQGAGRGRVWTRPSVKAHAFSRRSQARSKRPEAPPKSFR